MSASRQRCSRDHFHIWSFVCNSTAGESQIKNRLVTGRLVILFPVVLTTTCTDLFGEQHGYVPDCSYLFAKQVDPCRWNNLFQLVPWTTVFHYCDIKLFRIVIRTTCFIPVEQLAPTCSRYQVVTSRYIDLLPLVGPTTWYCLPWQVVPICWLIKIATSLSTTCYKVVSPTTCKQLVRNWVCTWPKSKTILIK